MNNAQEEKNITFRLYNPISQFDITRDIWTTLLKKCPHSYFLSWAWIETWITSLPSNCKIFLVAGYRNESPVIAFFLGSKAETRYRFFRHQILSLNSTLIPYIDDSAFIQYNAILVSPEITISLKSLLDNIPIKSWDELWIPRYSWTHSPNLILDGEVGKSYNVNITKKTGYYVDLDKIRRNNNDYLALLSSQRRKKIRRSLKEYEEYGEIQIFYAGNLDDALKIFNELVKLHQKTWMKRGHMGAFYYDYSINFHTNLITRRFDKGEIFLLKVSAGDLTIGCGYDYIYEDKVLGIQNGLSSLRTQHYLPGFICNYFEILQSVDMGLKSYDFLASRESEYKESLSTDKYEMQDMVITRKSTKSQLEHLTVSLYRLFRKLKETIFANLR